MHPSALSFRKSSYSQPTGNCVEVADTAQGTAVRDAQNRQSGHLVFGGYREWLAVLAAARRDHV